MAGWWLPAFAEGGDFGKQGEFPGKGEVEIFLGECLLGGAVGDDVEIEHEDVVEVAGSGLQVVMDDDDGLSCIAQFGEEFDNGLFGGGIDADEGFVHEIDVGVLGEGAGDEGALLLAAGEFADLALCEIGHAGLFEGGMGALAMGFSGSAEPAEAVVGTHQDDVENGDGEVPVDGLALRDVTDTSEHLVEGFVEDFDPAVIRRNGAHDGFDEGGFPSTVGADESGEGAGVDFHIDAVKHGLAIVGYGEVVGFDGDGHGVEMVRRWCRRRW